MFIRLTLAVVIAASALLAAADPSYALDRFTSRGPGKLVIRGFDTTSYFKAGTPKSGIAANTVTWKGKNWRFATAEDAAAFRASPNSYAPQFGAYCTGGLSQSHVVDGNPQIWRIHKGKLYLFFGEAGGKRFDKDPDGVIAKAQAYWNTLGVKKE